LQEWKRLIKDESLIDNLNEAKKDEDDPEVQQNRKNCFQVNAGDKSDKFKPLL